MQALVAQDDSVKHTLFGFGSGQRVEKQLKKDPLEFKHHLLSLIVSALHVKIVLLG